MQRATVTADMEFTLVGHEQSRLAVPVRLRYDAADPYAVTATFRVGPGDVVEWSFARDLLAAGVRRPCGEGDVQVWPDGLAIGVTLTSPSGRATLSGPLGAVAAFVARTNAIVPPGRESEMVDIDAELAVLLAP